MINIEEVKKYNASLREYKDKSSKLRAEIEFSEKELKRQCMELSNELGVEVTPDNVKQILEERIKKINNTMEIGNEILERIRKEEQQACIQSSPAPQPPQAYQTSQASQAPQAPQASQAPQAPQIPQPSMVSQSSASLGGLSVSDLPPIFAHRNNV